MELHRISIMVMVIVELLSLNHHHPFYYRKLQHGAFVFLAQPTNHYNNKEKTLKRIRKSIIIEAYPISLAKSDH